MRWGGMSARDMNTLDHTGTCWDGEQECHWQEVPSVSLEAAVTIPLLRPVAVGDVQPFGAVAIQ